MANILQIPDGNMRIGERPSKKLENMLKSFLTSQQLDYDDDESLDGIYKVYFRLKNEICVEQAVSVRSHDYICRTTMSCHADPHDHDTIQLLCVLANRICCELTYGNFEINLQTGDIRYRTYYEPGDVVYDDDLAKMLGHPLDMINKYGKDFLDVLQ